MKYYSESSLEKSIRDFAIRNKMGRFEDELKVRTEDDGYGDSEVPAGLEKVAWLYVFHAKNSASTSRFNPSWVIKAVEDFEIRPDHLVQYFEWFIKEYLSGRIKSLDNVPEIQHDLIMFHVAKMMGGNSVARADINKVRGEKGLARIVEPIIKYWQDNS